MKYLLWFVALFAAAALLTMSSHSPAYVQLVYPPYRVEVSLTAFLIMLLMMFVIAYTMVRLLISFMGLSAQVKKYRLQHAQAKSRKLMDEMLSAYFEGRYAEAEKAAARAINKGETSTLHAIIAARSAHELREFGKRDAYLAASADRKVGDNTMRLMATTKFMLEQQDSRGAINALHQIHEGGGKAHPGTLTLELKAQQQAGNWDEVLRVLELLERHAAIDPPVAQQIREDAWREKIQQQTTLAGLNSCMKQVPVNVRRSSKFAKVALQALIQFGGGVAAEKLLRDNLDAQWDGEMAALYGDCISEDLVAQTSRAEKWLKIHNREAGLLLALGKLCMHQQLWGKAQNYLDASISLASDPETYRALGQLARQMGKPDEANKYFQRASEAE